MHESQRAGVGPLALIGCLALLLVAGAMEFPTPPLASPSLAPTLRPGSVPLATAAAVAVATPARQLAVDEFSIYVPEGLTAPAQVLLVLHGMGGTGEDFGRGFWNDAQHSGWVVVAPTFAYGDWWSPPLLTAEASRQLPRIAELMDRIPDLTGLAINPRALVYGYSRGGQTANRFALAYPERVAGVAILSAGTYTLPATFFGPNADAALPFPFGVSDLSRIAGAPFNAQSFSSVPFWIGVGENDASADEVPHEWDPYIGRTRVERAGRFADWVRRSGAYAELQLFPGLSHGEVDEERAAAVRFLASLTPGGPAFG